MNIPDFARTVAEYIQALVQIIIWLTIGIASIAASYIAVSAIWTGVKHVLRVIG